MNTILLPPQIDFVAHDDIPYTSAGSQDVYKHIKEAGEHINVHVTPPPPLKNDLFALPFASFASTVYSCFDARYVCGHPEDRGHLHI